VDVSACFALQAVTLEDRFDLAPLVRRRRGLNIAWRAQKTIPQSFIGLTVLLA
jgi:hypothetical protein